MSTYNQTVKTFIQSDAEFRTMYGYIRTALAGFGLVQTSDTGQLNPGTMTYPASNNTDAGYECWRFDDALQSTRPVGIKIRPGRGAANGVMRLSISVSMSLFTGAGAFAGVETAVHILPLTGSPSIIP